MLTSALFNFARGPLLHFKGVPLSVCVYFSLGLYMCVYATPFRLLSAALSEENRICSSYFHR